MDFVKGSDEPVQPERTACKEPSDFEFLNKDIEVDAIGAATGDLPEHVGPNLATAVKMTPRKFANSVLEVYDKLGNTSWLFNQALADPKAFLALLSKLIPKSVQLDDLAGFTVNVIDQFGARIEISKSDKPATNPPESGQLLIDTSGNPAPQNNASSHCSGEPPTTDIAVKHYEIKEKF